MARNKRERLYNVYRRNKNVINAISWKKARAKFKALTIKSKMENWEKFTNQRDNMEEDEMKGEAHWTTTYI